MYKVCRVVVGEIGIDGEVFVVGADWFAMDC